MDLLGSYCRISRSSRRALSATVEFFSDLTLSPAGSCFIEAAFGSSCGEDSEPILFSSAASGWPLGGTTISLEPVDEGAVTVTAPEPQ